ncbi:histone-lysine N-methyltransferase SETMAR [Elysia marginata]|uniref:Histone-lysine N-methyltransferase SETMAR n=1 Tax=Elysia marginata TaxID=1093978 RepID=A0AAV4F9J6_9GAST|nr:histone-lysine N-methyltransferase SETMAR [Elysia marginata]
MLMGSHKLQRDEIFQRLLLRCQQDNGDENTTHIGVGPGGEFQAKNNLFDNLITGDDLGPSEYPRDKAQLQSMTWKHPSPPVTKNFKVQRSAAKVMATVFWDAKGVILLDILPQGQCINASQYCSTLGRLRDAIRRNRPGLLRRGAAHLDLDFFRIKIGAATDRLCRTKQGGFTPAQFDIHTCAWCYLFITQSEDMIVHPIQQTLVVIGNQSVFPQWTILVPDAENDTLANRICQTTGRETCTRWKSCCSEARACCKRQLLSPPGQNGSCPRTWDGYGCWDDTGPGTTVYLGCPSFLEYSSSSRK